MSKTSLKHAPGTDGATRCGRHYANQCVTAVNDKITCNMCRKFLGLRTIRLVDSPIFVIGLNLDKILNEKGISRNRFADLLGLHSPNVRPFFKEGYNPKLQTMAEWAKVLGCKISDLIEGD